MTIAVRGVCLPCPNAARAPNTNGLTVHHIMSMSMHRAPDI